MGYSQNRIYTRLKTKYVFHCEDDWVFLKPVPIKKMMNILDKNKHLGQLILLREQKYNIPIDNKDDKYPSLKDYFTTNPHLFKTELFYKYYPFTLKITEEKWSGTMKKAGYRSGFLGYHENDIYVTHIGIKRKVHKV